MLSKIKPRPSSTKLRLVQFTKQFYYSERLWKRNAKLNERYTGPGSALLLRVVQVEVNREHV